LDRECRGVRPLGCMRSLACRRRWCGHGDDTKPTMCAWRWHRDRSMTSRIRPSGVQGRGGQRGSDLGLMARQTHVHRCVGVRGDGTAECRARSWTGEAGARPLGCILACARWFSQEARPRPGRWARACVSTPVRIPRPRDRTLAPWLRVRARAPVPAAKHNGEPELSGTRHRNGNDSGSK
jgi:hypothetical protein